MDKPKQQYGKISLIEASKAFAQLGEAAKKSIIDYQKNNKHTGDKTGKFSFAHIGAPSTEVLLTEELWQKVKPHVAAMRLSTIGFDGDAERCLAIPCLKDSPGTHTLKYFEDTWKNDPNLRIYIDWPLKNH